MNNMTAKNNIKRSVGVVVMGGQLWTEENDATVQKHWFATCDIERKRTIKLLTS